MPQTKDVIVRSGVVVETLPATTFRVQLDLVEGETQAKIVFAVLAGKLRRGYIKVLPGDYVKMEFSPYDLEHGRIVYRGRENKTYESPTVS